MALEIHYRDVSSDVLPLGFHVRLDAFAVHADGVYEDVTARVQWTSSDPGIAEPPSPLLATGAQGASPGTAMITAEYEGLTDSVQVTVSPLPRPTPYLEVAGERPRQAGLFTSLRAQRWYGPSALDVEDVTALATWTSSNPQVGIVDSTGGVTALGSGTVWMTASYGGLSASWVFSWRRTDAVRLQWTRVPAGALPAGAALDWHDSYAVNLVTTPAAAVYVAVLDRHNRLLSPGPFPATRIYRGGPDTVVLDARVTPLSDSGEICAQILLVTDLGVSRTFKGVCREVH